MVRQLLRSKTVPPRLRGATVTRPRLLTRLDEGLSGRLILVCAPAGYGKSTLVCDWLAQADDRFDAAWLSLDPEENDVAQFASYLLAALERATPGLAETVRRVLGQEWTNAADLFETVGEPFVQFLNGLDAQEKKLVVVLDDCHLITDYAVHRVLLSFLSHLPEAVTVALVTRVDPPLPLARLRSLGEVTSIRARDLRFTQEEAADFLNLTMGLGLPNASVAALTRRTEGWITGLQLAGLSLQNHEDVAGFVAEFAGDNRNVRNYLVDEVLAGQPPEVQQFLLATSLLERLTAPLCEAVLQGHDGEESGNETRAWNAGRAQEMLEYLERHNLFVTRLDEHCQWYRYHTLFAELLRFHLWREQRVNVAAVQLRVARWMAHHGLSTDSRVAGAAPNGHVFARGTFDRPSNALGTARLPAEPLEPLSQREVEVLQLLARDLSYQEIANQLFIALATVKTHVTHIYGKLGVHTRDEALARANETGLLYE